MPPKLAPQMRTYHRRLLNQVTRKGLQRAGKRVKELYSDHARRKASGVKRGSGRLWHDIASSIHFRTTRKNSITIYVDHYAARQKEQGGIIRGGQGRYRVGGAELGALRKLLDGVHPKHKWRLNRLAHVARPDRLRKSRLTGNCCPAKLCSIKDVIMH